MPPEARVAVFEDDQDAREILKVYLEIKGHKVVFEATSMPEAEAIIPTLGEHEIQVAVIDGNLTRGEDSGREGKRINEQIKGLFPNIKTVGNSLGLVEGVDVNIGKTNNKNLAQVITEL
jgi:DNA-binding NtrC family response regulator